MLEFREITIGDKPLVDKALAASDFRGAEYSFGNNLSWRRGANSKIALHNGFYICAATNPSFSCVNPAGEGDRVGIINELRQYALSQGTPLRLTGVTPDQMPFFEEQFHGAYTVCANPDYYDYVYSAADFRDFAGKKYHGKRNHLSRFRTLYNYTYAPITEADFDDCISFAAKQFDDKQDNGDGTAADVSFGDGSALIEQFAINTFFNHYNELGLRGGIIRIDGQIAAFTVGERLNSDTYDIHIEKADTSFHGAYTAIANGFASDLAPLTTYLNREEDLGIEGLRRSKQSYYPVFQIEKNTLTFKD